MAKKHCPYCNAPMVEYKQGLSKGLGRALQKILESNSSGSWKFHLADCGLTYSERENARKLQYWQLIEKLGDPEGKGGWWKITPNGYRFLAGQLSVQKYVWTYRGVVQRYEGPLVTVVDLIDGWKYRPDYAQEALPLEPQ